MEDTGWYIPDYSKGIHEGTSNTNFVECRIKFNFLFFTPHRRILQNFAVNVSRVAISMSAQKNKVCLKLPSKMLGFRAKLIQGQR